MDVLRGLVEDLEAQRAYVAERCPPHERVLARLPDALPFDRLAEVWRGRRFGAWYERPLLLLACLRDDALEEGGTHPLYEGVGPPARAAAIDADRVREAFADDRPLWAKLGWRQVQTNETSRAVAWMWPAHLLASRLDAPLSLHDVGTSAGLNLVADALPRIWSHAGGGALDIASLPKLGRRSGYDRHPLDVAEEIDARWLRACTWPGQAERLDRLDRAIAAWRAARPRPSLLTCSAADVPARLSRDTGPALAFQTLLRDYLDPDERSRYEAGMRRWVAEAGGQAVWVELEHDAAEGEYPARIVAHASHGDFELARCGAHPRSLRVDEPAVRAFLDGPAWRGSARVSRGGA